MQNENSDASNLSIGMFDSGIGGLTVMQQILQRLPQEKVIYLGDTARLPYGEKSSETIVRYSVENAIFLMQKNIKLLVIACNTASAYAIDKLQQIFNIPIVGVIAPGARKAVETSKTGRIAVLGTRGTIRSGEYSKEILRLLPTATLFPVACPLLVTLVEEHWHDHPVTRMVLEEYLEPLRKEKVDTLLLGCTHYPLLRHVIQEIMGEEVAIVDSAISCAEEVATILQREQLSRSKTSLEIPKHHYFVTDDPEKFQRLGKQFLGSSLTSVEVAKLMSGFV